MDAHNGQVRMTERHPTVMSEATSRAVLENLPGMISRLRASLKEDYQGYDRAEAAGDWRAAREAVRRLVADCEANIGRVNSAVQECEALAAELLVYRPNRHDRPPAPPAEGYCYVATAKQAWICAAAESRKTVYIQAGFGGGGYLQEHFTPELKTICGRAVAFPVSERYTSGGWPRLHELCPDCTRIMVERGIVMDSQAEAR